MHALFVLFVIGSNEPTSYKLSVSYDLFFATLISTAQRFGCFVVLFVAAAAAAASVAADDTFAKRLKWLFLFLLSIPLHQN